MAPPGDTEDKSDQDTASRFDLRILATTDLHMHLCGYDYYTDKEDPRIGLVRTATLIRAARREAETAGKAVLLVDNGDALQGTPMADVARQMRPHPLMQAFAELKYDAFGLGNHDFDFGPQVLFDMLHAAPCPVISSNLHGPVKGIEASAAKVFQLPDGAGAVRVGILSVLPPQTLQWNAHHLAKDYTIDDMTAAVASKAAQLKAEGCDLVLVLAHTGVALSGADNTENAVVPIAALPDVDAIVGGHTHLHLPGRAHLGLDHVDAERGLVHGKPVVMPGYGGSHLGVIDLSLQATQHGWNITEAQVSLRSVAPPDAPPVAPDCPVAKQSGPG